MQRFEVGVEDVEVTSASSSELSRGFTDTGRTWRRSEKQSGGRLPISSTSRATATLQMDAGSVRHHENISRGAD